MKVYILFFTLIYITLCGAQNESQTKIIDSLYKEDQFYIGVTYNLLNNRPKNVSQNGFSVGYHLGVIKDIPINKNRNIAIGVGLGYSGNSFNQNIVYSESLEGVSNFISVNSSSFTRNRFSMHLLELPVEFRWRTSTPESYEFWRIYTGFKLGYVFANATNYKGDLGRLRFTNIEDMNDLQYGLTLSVGYNTWNIHLYYALNSIFKNSAEIGNAPIDSNIIKVGLMFYIL